MLDALVCHTALRVGDVVGHLAGEVVNALDDPVGVKADFLGHPAPMARLDIAEVVFTAELHRKFRLIEVDLGVVGKGARQIVKRRQTDAALRADEYGVILGMGVRADN